MPPNAAFQYAVQPPTFGNHMTTFQAAPAPFGVQQQYAAGPPPPAASQRRRGDDNRPNKRQRGPAPLRSPSPVASSSRVPYHHVNPAPTSSVVRFGLARWNSDPVRLRREVKASGQAAWDAMPGVWDNVGDITRAPDISYALINFPSPLLAKTFVDAWVANKNTATDGMSKMRADIMMDEPKSCTIRILSWNIHGNFALNLRSFAFRSLLCAYDVVLVQETFLRPGQDEQLELPHGYECITLSRPESQHYNQRGGGLAVLHRTALACENLTPANQHEYMVVSVGDIILFNVYLPPPTSPWLAHQPALAEERLHEALLPFVEARRAQLVVMGDFNARMGMLHTTLRRSSPDEVVSARGRRILATCESLHLELLNGSSVQPLDARARYTSFQAGGSSVIDLALASRALLAEDPTRVALDTLPHLPQWSDHAAIVLSIKITSAAACSEPPRRRKLPQRSGLPPNPHPTALDDLLERTLAPLKRKDTQIVAFYGVPWLAGPALNVYVAVKTPPHDPLVPADTRSSCATYWGPAHRSNWSAHVPGPPSNARAALWSALHAIVEADPTRVLHIWTRELYLIRTLAHWAPELARAGWKCVHADLLRPLTALLQARAAPVRFMVQRGPDSAFALSAMELADAVPPSLAHAAQVPPVVPSHWARPPTSGPPPLHDLLKVWTPLPAVNKHAEASTRADGLHIPPEMQEVIWTESGYQGLPIISLRYETFCSLIHAPSNAHFWKILDSLTGVKLRPALVSADSCHTVFYRRMNPPEILPPQFDRFVHAVNQLAGKSLPRVTQDTTPLSHFSTPFTLEEIDDAKAHIRKRNLSSAHGLDGIGYRDVLALPSEKLRELFQACIDSGEIPHAWTTAVLAAVKKPKKDGTSPVLRRHLRGSW